MEGGNILPMNQSNAMIEINSVETLHYRSNSYQHYLPGLNINLLAQDGGDHCDKNRHRQSHQESRCRHGAFEVPSIHLLNAIFRAADLGRYQIDKIPDP